jgi:hypothetical protein
MSDATRLLKAAAGGDHKAAADLMPLVYLRLVGDQQFDGRGYFFAAAEAMRRVLVEAARRKKLPKHGGRRRIEAQVPLGSRIDNLHGDRRHGRVPAVAVLRPHDRATRPRPWRLRSPRPRPNVRSRREIRAPCRDGFVALLFRGVP